MSGKEDPVIQEIISLHKSNDYLGIIDLFKSLPLNDKAAISNIHLVTWPIPAEKDLEHFSEFIHKYKINQIYSIGCGTGLLEWLMCKCINSKISNGFPIVELVGIEIDRHWWTSQYSPPAFIPLKFVSEDFDLSLPFGKINDVAIFCYFNNIQIFLEYLGVFQGTFVVLIGPISNKQYCAPGPLDLAKNVEELPTDQWNLLSCQQFGLVEIDHIALYQRICQK